MNRKLRRYQWDATLYLCGKIGAGHRVLGLNAPTGSGKTVIIASLLLKGSRALFRGAVIAAPTIQVKANFYKDWDLTALPKVVEFSTSIIRLCAEKGDLFVHSQSEEKLADFQAVLQGVPVGDPWVFLTTHAQLVHENWWKKVLPPDLTGHLLVLDEAHHAGRDGEDDAKAAETNTKIGEFAAEWIKRGGMVLFVTATPFRPDEKDVFPPGTQAFVWTIAEHAQAGFAPNDFKMHTVTIDGLGDASTTTLAGDELTAEEDTKGSSYRAMVDRWVADGKPKAVFIVPPKGADQWATGLYKALDAVKPAGKVIVNAVGTDAEAANNLADALQGPRDAKGRRKGGEQDALRYEDSRVAAILACKRFDEGTDWKFCSHVYCYGISSSFALVIQRWGRAFRNKRKLADEQGIDGYPTEHIDSAHVTFFVPKVKPEVLKQFEQQHHHFAFLLACYMADWETGKDIAGELRIRLEKHWERRPTSTALEDINRRQEVKVPDGLRTRMRALVERFKAEYRVRTRGQQPSHGEVEEYLDSLDLTDDERHAAEWVVYEDVASQNPGALNMLEAELGALERLSRNALRSLFRKAVAPFCDQTSPSEVGDRVIAFLSSFTGQDAGEVAASLVKNCDLDIPEAEVVRRVIRPYVSKHRKAPDLQGGVQDVSSLLGGGVPTTLYDVDRMLRRRGLDLARMVGCMDWVDGPPVDVDALRAKLAPHAQRLRARVAEASASKHYECTGNLHRARTFPRFDLSREFGIQENLVGLAMAARFGWRGVPKGTSLGELLWPQVQAGQAKA